MDEHPRPQSQAASHKPLQAPTPDAIDAGNDMVRSHPRHGESAAALRQSSEAGAESVIDQVRHEEHGRPHCGAAPTRPCLRIPETAAETAGTDKVDDPAARRSPREGSASRPDCEARGGHALEAAQTRPGSEGSNEGSQQHAPDSLKGGIVDSLKTAAGSLRDMLKFDGLRKISPLNSFNPTFVRLRYRLKRKEWSEGGGPDEDVAVLLRSRDRRKGRHAIALPRSASGIYPGSEKPVRYTSRGSEVLKGIRRMLTTFPYWDMAYWVSFWYLLGSMVWVANGLFAWLPCAFARPDFARAEPWGAGMTAIVGVVLFQLGAILAYLESVNGCFLGPAINRLLAAYDSPEQHKKELFKATARDVLRNMFPSRKPKAHRRLRSLHKASQLEAGWVVTEGRDGDAAICPPTCADILRLQDSDGQDNIDDAEEYMQFRWWPSAYSFKTYQRYEIGFAATTIQLIGATIFIVNGFTALPGILDVLNSGPQWKKNMAYWIPDIVASVLFITPSWLFMIETQENWWKPAPKILGWWIGLWALVGSFGFLLCGVLGLNTYHHSHAMQWQALLASLWGSVCFLVSSLLMMYEAVNKISIEELDYNFDDPTTHQDRYV